MTHEQLVEKVTELVDRYDPTRHEPYNTARAILSLIADALGEPTDAMKTAAGLVCGSRDIGHEAIAGAIDASPLKAGDSHKPGEGV